MGGKEGKIINSAGQQPRISGCYTGKEEQYPEELLAYNCSKCPVLTGKRNAACIIYLILTFCFYKKKADT